MTRHLQPGSRQAPDAGRARAQRGVYQYRLVAWNAYGWSPDAVSEPVSTADPALPCPSGAGAGAGGRAPPPHRGRAGAWLAGAAAAALAAAAAAAVLLLRPGWGRQVRRCVWRCAAP